MRGVRGRRVGHMSGARSRELLGTPARPAGVFSHVKIHGDGAKSTGAQRGNEAGAQKHGKSFLSPRSLGPDRQSHCKSVTSSSFTQFASSAWALTLVFLITGWPCHRSSAVDNGQGAPPAATKPESTKKRRGPTEELRPTAASPSGAIRTTTGKRTQDAT